ncbi:MAG TPA: aminotransferase class V-fold PLP-dependent enzyme [Gemmatimonadaceae bacterium]|nr:aminotransferase class V-fold PLP-dependent enzyme [Gemmatimonadaceae bacterium]
MPTRDSVIPGSTEAETQRNSPISMPPEEFRKLGYRVVDSLAELIATFPDRPVAPGATPSAIREQLGQGSLPPDGRDAAAILDAATGLLFRNSTFNGHPKFFGYITAPAAPIGILGEFLAAGINANVGAWSLSPAATEIERQTVAWIADLIGFPASCGGIFVSGGNMANMVCMLVARAAHLSNLPAGVRHAEARPHFRIYASTETHTWIEKALDIMGLDPESLRKIPVDSGRRMRIEDLESFVATDLAAGLVPLAVIGTAGTVSTGSVDPLVAIGAFCRRERIWFHVDGAYGAPAAALAVASDDLKALSEADSVAVDPHKWLYAPLEAGCSLIRDGALLRQAFAHHPPYYHFADAEGEPVFNYHEHGPQNSRGFRALKVWLALQQVGRSGYVRMIEDDCRLARLMFDTVAANEYLDAVSCELSIATFAFVPPELRGDAGSADYLNELNTELLSELQQNGEVYVSNAVIDGRFVLRACIVNFRTSDRDIRESVEIIVRTGIAVDARMRNVWSKSRNTDGSPG